MQFAVNQLSINIERPCNLPFAHARSEKLHNALCYIHYQPIRHQCISKKGNKVLPMEITDNLLVELATYENALKLALF